MLKSCFNEELGKFPLKIFSVFHWVTNYSLDSPFSIIYGPVNLMELMIQLLCFEYSRLYYMSSSYFQLALLTHGKLSLANLFRYVYPDHDLISIIMCVSNKDDCLCPD